MADRPSWMEQVLEELPDGLSRRDFEELYNEYLFRSLDDQQPRKHYKVQLQLLASGLSCSSPKGMKKKRGDGVEEGYRKESPRGNLPREEEGKGGTNAHVRAGVHEPAQALALTRSRTHEADWFKRPTHQGLLDELSRGSGLPADKRSILAHLGLFHARYKSWCGAVYRETPLGQQYQDMATLVEREGAANVVIAIELLFKATGPLDWVGRKTLDFLADPGKWSRFVAPAMAMARQKAKGGEQAEWKGETSAEEAVVVKKRGVT